MSGQKNELIPCFLQEKKSNHTVPKNRQINKSFFARNYLTSATYATSSSAGATKAGTPSLDETSPTVRRTSASEKRSTDSPRSEARTRSTYGACARDEIRSITPGRNALSRMPEGKWGLKCRQLNPFFSQNSPYETAMRSFVSNMFAG